MGLEQRPHCNGAAKRDAVTLDSDSKTIDLRRRTERRKMPEIAYEEKRNRGHGSNFYLYVEWNRADLSLQKV